MVIMYADRITDRMQKTIDETNRRRIKQIAYNQEHNITPTQIKKARNLSVFSSHNDESGKPYIEADTPSIIADPVVQFMNKDELKKTVEQTRKMMKKAAKELDFIQAAQYRDELFKLEELLETK